MGITMKAFTFYASVITGVSGYFFVFLYFRAIQPVSFRLFLCVALYFGYFISLFSTFSLLTANRVAVHLQKEG